MRLTRPSTLALTLLTLGGWAASTVEASPISQPIDYATTGFVGGNGSLFTFGGNTGSFLEPGVIQLGSLHVDALPDDTSQSVNTPFTLDVGFPTGPNGQHPWGHVAITGTLTGIVTGGNFSNVLATFTSVQQDGSVPLPFSIGNFQPIGPVHIGPSSVNGGWTSLYAYVGPKLAGEELAVPEPSTLAFFGVALAGLGWSRRARKASAC